MKRARVCLLAAVLSVSSTTSALAAEPAGLGIEVSAHGAGLVPLGAWGDLSGPLLGALVSARYALPVDGLSARARAGFLFGIPKRTVTTYALGGELVLDARTDAIPFWVGADYATPIENLSVHGELGLTIVNESGSGRANGQVVSTSNQRLGFTLDAGASYDLGVVRVGLDVVLADLFGTSLLPGIMLHVGLPIHSI